MLRSLATLQMAQNHKGTLNLPRPDFARLVADAFSI
jgi:hypothetical protein